MAGKAINMNVFGSGDLLLALPDRAGPMIAAWRFDHRARHPGPISTAWLSLQ
jgi:hypothetical protein